MAFWQNHNGKKALRITSNCGLDRIWEFPRDLSSTRPLTTIVGSFVLGVLGVGGGGGERPEKNASRASEMAERVSF